jgi:hypothetical protein
VTKIHGKGMVTCLRFRRRKRFEVGSERAREAAARGRERPVPSDEAFFFSGNGNEGFP